MKVTPKKSQRGSGGVAPLRRRDSRKSDTREDAEPPLPMLEMDDDIESEMPIRGRPSKKLLLQKQQQRAQLQAKHQAEQNSKSATAQASAAAQSGRTKAAPGSQVLAPVRTKAKRSLYKKGDNVSAKAHSESYVMRLFERSLDLSKYEDSTPLYPICRAWMANQPRNPSVAMYNTDGSIPIVKREDDGEEILAKLRSGELKVVTQMPKPLETDMSPIPERLPKSTSSVDLQGSSKEKLLAENMTHWKRVRNHWIKHSQKYEAARYGIINQIMDVVCSKE